MNSLYDKAFDRGLVTFSDDLPVVISPVLRAQSPSQFHQWALLDIEGASLNLPARFAPDPISLAFHREHVFSECVMRQKKEDANHATFVINMTRIAKNLFSVEPQIV